MGNRGCVLSLLTPQPLGFELLVRCREIEGEPPKEVTEG